MINRSDNLKYTSMGIILSVLNLTGTCVLHTIGFGTTGVSAGSLAASIQTSSTVAGSLFAMAQSAGATGAGSALVTTIGGATISSLGGIAMVFRNVIEFFCV